MDVNSGTSAAFATKEAVAKQSAGLQGLETAAQTEQAAVDLVAQGAAQTQSVTRAEETQTTDAVKASPPPGKGQQLDVTA